MDRSLFLTRSREGIEEKKIARLFLLFLRGFAPSREVSHFPLRFDDGEEVGAVDGVAALASWGSPEALKNYDGDDVHLD